MIRWLVANMSFWWIISGCILFFIALSYLSARLSVYFFTVPIDKDHRQLANTLIGILSGGFSILLAFVIINTWNYLMEARNNTSKEADYLAVLIRDSSAFPPEARKKIIAAIRNYTVTVRVDEWKAMRRGHESQKAWDNLEVLFHTLQLFHPNSPYETIYYNQALINMNNLAQSRRERLNKLDSIIPAPLKGSLIIGSILLAIILGSIRGEKDFISITPALLFAASLGFNLALALSFDYPYSGDIAVSNQLFYSGLLGKFSD